MMKTFLAAVLVAVAFAPAFGQQGAAASASAQWDKFAPPEKHFSVILPGTPQEESNTTTDPKAGPYTTHLYMARDGGSIYIVGWVDYDPKFNFHVQSELEANRDNLAKGVKAKVLNTTPIKLGTHPGIEFTAENERAFFRSRVYIVGKRPYQLIAVSPKGSDESPNVGKFLSSFALTPPAGR